jgi:hypothetical protein
VKEYRYASAKSLRPKKSQKISSTCFNVQSVANNHEEFTKIFLFSISSRVCCGYNSLYSFHLLPVNSLIKLSSICLLNFFVKFCAYQTECHSSCPAKGISNGFSDSDAGKPIRTNPGKSSGDKYTKGENSHSDETINFVSSPIKLQARCNNGSYASKPFRIFVERRINPSIGK